MMTGVLMFVADESDPYGLVTRYVSELAPGSYLSLSHLSADHKSPQRCRGSGPVLTPPPNTCTSARRPGWRGSSTGLELVPPYAGRRGPSPCYTGVWGAEDPVARGHRRLPLAVVRGRAASLT